MVNYVWDRMKAEYSDPVCWFSWLILALWPATLLVGVITQAKVTGKDCNHQEGTQLCKSDISIYSFNNKLWTQIR